MQTGDWLVSKDPRMKPKLAALQAMFPHITMTVLQERLAAAEGHLPNAVKVTCLPLGKHPAHRARLHPCANMYAVRLVNVVQVCQTDNGKGFGCT